MRSTIFLYIIYMRIIASRYPLIQFSFGRQFLKNLDRNLLNEHFYVRNHYLQIQNQMCQLIKSNNWLDLSKVLKKIDINQLDSWLTLHNIAKQIQKNAKTLDLEALGREIILKWLQCLSLVKYQVALQQSPSNLQNKKYKFPSALSYQLTSYLNKISEVPSQQFHYLSIAMNLVHTTPHLFNQSTIERIVKHNIEELIRKHILNRLLVNGCISKFWSTQFKQFILGLRRADINKTCFLFSQLNIPNQLKFLDNDSKLRVEMQIANILKGFGYEIQSNVNVNGYEIDFMISRSNFIIEYNGLHHYIINSDHVIETARQKWKLQILKKRGFGLSVIPYYQWKRLQLFKEKQEYLVNKIQSDWIKHINQQQQ